MRKQLKRLGKDERHTFTATFKRLGYKIQYDEEEASFNHEMARDGFPMPYHDIADDAVETILLTNVCINDEQVTEHLWADYKPFTELGELHKGEKLQFTAVVTQYEKGYFTDIKSKDFGLTKISDTKLLTSLGAHRELSMVWLKYSNRNLNALIGYITYENLDYYESNNIKYSKQAKGQFDSWAKYRPEWENYIQKFHPDFKYVPKPAKKTDKEKGLYVINPEIDIYKQVNKNMDDCLVNPKKYRKLLVRYNKKLAEDNKKKALAENSTSKNQINKKYHRALNQANRLASHIIDGCEVEFDKESKIFRYSINS